MSRAKTKVEIPERLQEELKITNEMLEELKQKNPNWEKDAGVIVKAVEKIPAYFTLEQGMVNNIINQQEENLNNLANLSDEKFVAMHREILEKIKINLSGTENFWVNKLIEFQTKINRMLQ